MTQLVDHLGVKPRDDSIAAGSRLYSMALTGGFTRGRRTALVRTLLDTFSTVFHTSLPSIAGLPWQWCRMSPAQVNLSYQGVPTHSFRGQR